MVRVVLRPRTTVILQPPGQEQNGAAERKKNKAERQREYRKKIKEDPKRYQEYKNKECVRKKKERKSMTDENKEHYREKGKLRQRKYAEKLKAGGMSGTKKKVKIKTRKAKKDQRKKWREAKEKEKENRTPQKVAWIRKKDRLRKQKSKPNLLSPEPGPADQTSGFPTNSAKRQALRRLRRSTPKDPTKFAEVIKTLLEKAPREYKDALNEMGVTSRPNSNTHQNGASLERETLKKVVKSLRSLKSQPARAARMMVSAHILHKYKHRGAVKMGLTTRYQKKLATMKEGGDHIIAMKLAKRKKRPDALPDATVQSIEDFYRRPDNAREIPDKRVVKRDLLGRMVLEKKIANLHKEWCNENRDNKVSLAKFALLRPDTVIPLKRSPHEQCLCETCVNVEHILEPLLKACREHQLTQLPVKQIFESKYAVVAEWLCKPEKPEENSFPKLQCIEGNCQTCGAGHFETKLKPLTDVAGDDTATWQQWCQGTYTGKDGVVKKKKTLVTNSGTIREVVSMLQKRLPNFTMHIFVSNWQHKAYRKMTDQLIDNKNDAMAVMDFAENYTMTFQKEIQSAHWMKSMVTVHPIVYTYVCHEPECKQIMRDVLIIVSDDLKHDSHAVQAFRNESIRYLKKKMPNLMKLTEWTDGCAAQYKSKGPFVDLSFGKQDYGIEVERNFFGSGHGKGPCDGEGGIVKQGVKLQVLSTKAVVRNAKEFFTLCSESELTKGGGHPEHFSRTFKYISSEIIVRDRPAREVKQAVRGTQKIHSIQPVSTGNLKVRDLTENSNYPEGLYVQPWRQVAMKIETSPVDEPTESVEDHDG
jgi:hypothetical protein